MNACIHYKLHVCVDASLQSTDFDRYFPSDDSLLRGHCRAVIILHGRVLLAYTVRTCSAQLYTYDSCAPDNLLCLFLFLHRGHALSSDSGGPEAVDEQLASALTRGYSLEDFNYVR